MAWIELHQTLPRHPKLIRLANRLRVCTAQAAGHLTFLWLWTLDYAPNGDLSAFEPAEISAAACFPGDAELFAKALIETGWLDEGMQVHDWMEYAGRLVEQRSKDRDRKRSERERRSTGPPGPVRRMSAGRPPDIPVTADVPNPTQPNQEAHSQARTREGPWPGLAEVLKVAELRAVPKEVAEKWWLEHDARGGLDKTGQPLDRWESSLLAYAATWRANVEKEKQRHANANSRPGIARPDRNAGTANAAVVGQYANAPGIIRR
jgi:hypothetical protein